jgi:hypothetical protein
MGEKRRKPLQFGLGSLFALTAIVAALSAWFDALWLLSLAMIGGIICMIWAADEMGKVRRS